MSEEGHKISSGAHLLHLLTAALYSLIGVYTGRDGGQLLLLLSLPHLGVHTVDEILHGGHLDEKKHINTFIVRLLAEA